MSKPKRVLVVDDERHILFVLQDTLRRLGPGVEVGVAQGGAEALALVAQSPFDLIITDLVMPGMDGVELTAAVAEACPGTVVIWMTAHGSHRWQADAARLAVYRCLDKPLDIATIRQIISAALEDPDEPGRDDLCQDGGTI